MHHVSDTLLPQISIITLPPCIIYGQLLFIFDVKAHEQPPVERVQRFVAILLEASIQLTQGEDPCHEILTIIQVSQCLLIVSVFVVSLRI